MPPRRSTTNRRALGALIILAGVLGSRGHLAAQPASGQQRAPGPSPVKDPHALAFQFAEAGNEALKNGDYDTAIDLFEKANAQVPHPLFLYDIAQAHRKIAVEARGQNMDRAASHRERARDFYRQFLATEPTGKEADVARDWLARLDRQHAEDFPGEEEARRQREQQAHDEAVAAERARLAEEARLKRERDALEAQRIARAVVATKVKSEKRRAAIVRLAGGGALGLGAVAVGAGVYYALEARGISDELTNADRYDAAKIEAGNQAEQKMFIGYVVGGALIVGGLVTYIVGNRMGSQVERLRPIGITPVPGGATLAIGGGF